MLLTIISAALQVPLGLLLPPSSLSSTTPNTCIVPAAPNGDDSAPAITAAFQRCGHNDDKSTRGKVIFSNHTTYTIRSVLNTTDLRNVDIELPASTTLRWDNSDLAYWLRASLPVGYQNQSTAWLFGGDNIRWTGGSGGDGGTLDGGGQAWYDFANGTNNYPGRPHQLTITGTRGSVLQGLRFVQSQMWTMTVIHSQNVLLQDIYVNSTDANRPVGFDFSSLNTDGADTVYADNITFRNWTIDNGDDSIAVKANSTNILVENCHFHTGLGFAVGSIGQYPGAFETIQNITVRNITIHPGMRYAAYVKTWTGSPTGYPPNGGGGGRGFAANISLTDFVLREAAGLFAITQCTSYNDARGGCDTSPFQIRDLTLRNWRGTATSDVVAELQCSGAAPCTGVVIEDVDVWDTVNGTRPASYLCESVVSPVGFNCTGKPWGENPR